LKIRVLGSAAGGGFPQWNCGCANCREGRRPGGRAHPRTQESVAVSSDDKSWFLINASPEIRAQLEDNELAARAPRHTPIAGILLTNGDLDHCLGLLSLRESQPLVIWATDAVRALCSRLTAALAGEGMSMSFGWAVCPRDGDSALLLYRAADERLYAQKLIRSRLTAAKVVSMPSRAERLAMRSQLG